jgi:tetratricopeptide (TPR) repeat protein
MLTIKNQAWKKHTIFLAAVTLFTACSPPGVRALLEGKKLMDMGDYQPAVEKLRSAVVLLGSTNAQAYNYLGLACHHAGQFSEAERSYQRALALNPDLVEARFNLGCLWLSQNKLEQAKGELTTVTLRRSSSADGWLKLGTAQLRSKDLAGAEKSLSEAIRLSPQNAEALTGLGLVRLQRGRAGEAVQFFAKALKEQPGYRPALLNWAIVAQENLRDPNQALQKYREYLALKPAPENAESVKVLVHQLEGELAPPKPIVTNVIAQPITNPVKTAPPEVAHNAPAKPSAPDTVRAVSPPKMEEATNVSKPPASTITNVTKSTPVSPPPPDTNFEVVKLAPEPVFKPAANVTPSSPPRQEPAFVEKLAVTSTPPAVVPETKPAKRSFFQRINPINLFSGPEKASPQAQPQKDVNSPATAPETGSLAQAATDSSGGSGQFARYVYRSPAKPEPGNHAQAEASFTQGLQAQQGQRLPEAIQAYSQAIQADPGYFDAYYNLGLVTASSGNLQLSLGAYETALAIRPEALDARYNFALALKQANYPIDAANELERLLTIYPNNSRAHLALGNLYAQQLGQPARARQHYLKMLETDPRNPQAPAVRYWLTAHPK